MTRKMFIGGLPIGGGSPISVQSMTNTDTRDVEGTLEQIRGLHKSGCEIVRVSVYDEDCAGAVRQLVDGSPVPLVADVHFSHKLAIKSVENGIAKLRINPGNIGGAVNVKRLADCVKMHKIPVRIGVNMGSLEKEILAEYGATAQAMVNSALNHARLLEDCGFYDIVISMKASDVKRTVEAYRIAAKATDYPLHIGITEAGLPKYGSIKSAVGLGALLLEGIGDTMRISLTGDPKLEAQVAMDILRAVGIRKSGVEIISCPTCGRKCMDVEGVARAVEAATRGIDKPLTVAVMGCVVNGPGEAREADIGIAGGASGCVMFRKGQAGEVVRGDPAAALVRGTMEIIFSGAL